MLRKHTYWGCGETLSGVSFHVELSCWWHLYGKGDEHEHAKSSKNRDGWFTNLSEVAHIPSWNQSYHRTIDISLLWDLEDAFVIHLTVLFATVGNEDTDLVLSCHQYADSPAEIIEGELTNRVAPNSVWGESHCLAG